MRPQYHYDPPRNNWVERLKEPPLKYILIVLGIVIAVYAMFALPEYGARILILLVAFPIHELAHAFTAYRLGDPTPKYDGRLMGKDGDRRISRDRVKKQPQQAVLFHLEQGQNQVGQAQDNNDPAANMG